MLEIFPVEPDDKTTIVNMFNKEKVTWPWGMGVPWFRYWNHRGRTERWDKALLNGIIVGSIHWSIRLDNTRNLYDLVTLPDVRNKGVGRALVNHIGTPIKLKTDVGAPSNDFYLKMGFVKGQTEITRSGNKYVTTYTLPRKRTTMKKPWITTYTGLKVNPLELRPEDICIEDIAHGLALCNRFVGQSIKPISVAQHSVCVSQLCAGTPYEMQGLLHDASEAYLGDMSKWVKQTPEMEGFRKVEKAAQDVIFERFGCLSDLADVVQEADVLMVRFEAPQAFGECWDGFDSPIHDKPITPEEEKRIGRWAPLNWRAAEDAFLAQFRRINRYPRFVASLAAPQE